MGSRNWIRAQLTDNLGQANRTGRQAAKLEPRAAEVRFLLARHELLVRPTNGALLGMPVKIIAELISATRAQLSDIEILPGGDGLHWAAKRIWPFAPTESRPRVPLRFG